MCGIWEKLVDQIPDGLGLVFGLSLDDLRIVLLYSSSIQLSLILQIVHVLSAQSVELAVRQNGSIHRVAVFILVNMHCIPLTLQLLRQVPWVV